MHSTLRDGTEPIVQAAQYLSRLISVVRSLGSAFAGARATLLRRKLVSGVLALTIIATSVILGGVAIANSSSPSAASTSGLWVRCRGLALMSTARAAGSFSGRRPAWRASCRE